MQQLQQLTIITKQKTLLLKVLFKTILLLQIKGVTPKKLLNHVL